MPSTFCRVQSELRESDGLHSLPGTSGAESVNIESLQQQVQQKQAMELFELTTEELDRLYQVHQKTVSEMQQLKDQLDQSQKQNSELLMTNQNLESTNQQILTTVAEQSREIVELHCQLRQAQLLTATNQVDKMTTLCSIFQENIRRREEDVAEAQTRRSVQAAEEAVMQKDQVTARLQALCLFFTC
nr:sodium channel and clathrin linker 1-like [Nothobranchius furzeri]